MDNIKNSKYFNDLFESLKEEDGYVHSEDQEIKTPEDLADFMSAELSSNIQYDFNIDFDDEDVIKFCEAIVLSNSKHDNSQEDNTVYIDDITGTLGNWLDDNLDKSIPQNVIDAINNAYVLARDYLCDEKR